MEVGLLSMQRVANYGSFWQAYCLKKMICDTKNCNLEFIDIIPGEIDTRTEYKKSFSFSKIKRIPYYLFQREKKMMFLDYQRKILGCEEGQNYRSDYDAIIIGSDEVFNFVQQSPWGFSTQLYGDIKNNNVNSYAACFGYTTLETIQHTKREERIAKGLNNLRNVSVRDSNSAEIVEKLTGNRPDIHMDPVIVGDIPMELPEISDKGYILVYSYDFRMSDSYVIQQVRDFAKKKKIKIISAGFYQDWADKNVVPNPYELLSYFDNADYVVTDTFHGTIFSVRMHKNFLTVIRDTNKQKLSDLLSRIGMSDRRYSNGDSLVEAITKDIDYEQFESLRVKEKHRTDTYLMNCLTKS